MGNLACYQESSAEPQNHLGQLGVFHSAIIYPGGLVCWPLGGGKLVAQLDPNALVLLECTCVVARQKSFPRRLVSVLGPAGGLLRTAFSRQDSVLVLCLNQRQESEKIIQKSARGRISWCSSEETPLVHIPRGWLTQYVVSQPG